MKRTARVVLALAMLAVLVTGCIQTAQEIVVDDDGMADITIQIKGDKALAEEELLLYSWQLQQLVPQLNAEYERSQYVVEEGYNEYLVYEWRAKRKIPVTDIAGVEWREQDDAYEFRMQIPKVLDEVSESDRNDVVMEISLTMPGEIEFANTPFVEGSTARWVLTKEQLQKSVRLMARAVRTS